MDSRLPNRGRPCEFTWKIINRCNYQCEYCFFTLTRSWEYEAAREVLLPTADWIEAWRRIYQNYGSAQIGITGGEPIYYPGFETLAEQLAGWHRLSIVTNLSRDLRWVKEFLGRVSPDRVDFGLSFHPQSARIEEFVPKLALIHRAGFPYRLYLVCYPPLLPRLLSSQKLFAREGFHVVAAPFRGRYQGREYPMAYTPDEAAVIRQMSEASGQESQSWVSQQMDSQSTYGRLCHAGQFYLRVENDGSVWRCGQYCEDAIKLPMLNFLDPAFRLCAEAAPCAARRCGCEKRFLQES